MADLAIQKFADVGISPVFGAATVDGDTYTNLLSVYLFIKNEGASPITVTAVAQKPCNQGTLHDEVLTVNAGQTLKVAPLTRAFYNDNAQKVHLTYSGVTSVSVATLAF